MRETRSLRITIRFSESTYNTLRLRAIRHAASVEGYIKRILNKRISANRLPEPEPFIRHWPTTKSHYSDQMVLTTTYPPMYLDYLDRLAENIPAHYGTGAKTRRRLIETLVLIDLFDTGD